MISQGVLRKSTDVAPSGSPLKPSTKSSHKESMSPPPVQYRKLGKSGLKVSVPIIGGLGFGSKSWLPWVLEEEEALPVLKAAWDRGINTFDTANVYSNGESERIIGVFIKKYNIPRNNIVICTKCKGCVGKDLSMRAIEHPELKILPEYINQWSLSRTAIMTSVDASLKRLGTTYIDLLQIHRFDPETTPEETMKALHDLVESGKVRYIGACSMRTWHFAMYQDVAEKHNWTKFVSMQNEYSLLYREDEHEMIPYCKHNGIGLIPWGPVAVGALTRPVDQSSPRWDYKVRSLSEADKTIINRVEEVSKKRGVTMAQVALAWVGAKTVSPVVGVSSVGRVDDNIFTGFELTEEEMKYLEEPYAPKPVRNHP